MRSISNSAWITFGDVTAMRPAGCCHMPRCYETSLRSGACRPLGVDFIALANITARLCDIVAGKSCSRGLPVARFAFASALPSRAELGRSGSGVPTFRDADLFRVDEPRLF